MARKILSVLLCLIFAVCFLTVFAGEDLIVNGGFDGTTMSFTAVSPYAVSPYSGMFCAAVSDPQLRNIDGGVLHSCEYLYSVSLSKGALYEFSMYVRADGAPQATPHLFVDYLTDDNRIMFNVSGIDESWQRVTGLFMAGSGGAFDIGLSLFTYSEDVMLYVDDISLRQINGKPVSMQIAGARNVLIPDAGVTSYKYSAVAIDENGKELPIITGDISVLGELPQGTVFLQESSSLVLSSDTLQGDQLTLTAKPPGEFPGLRACSVVITAGKNYIENGDFSDFPYLSGFEAVQGEMKLDEKDGMVCARLDTQEVSDNNYRACIQIDKTCILSPDKMYVFRAEVFSDDSYYSRQTEATNGVMGASGSIDIKITDVGDTTAQVMSVIRVEAEGVYQLNISFENGDERPVYISHMGLYAEELKPSDVIFSAPAHITIPQSGTLSVPVNFAVRDQGAAIMNGEVAQAYIEPQGCGVSVSGKTLSVSSTAKRGEYRLCAVAESNKNVIGTHSVMVSDEGIGDGSFENQNPGQWFSTAQPSSLNIVSSYGDEKPTDGKKLGKLAMNGNVSAVLSDSVHKFEAGKAYVFSGFVKPVQENIPTVLSVIIYNAYAQSFEDNLAVVQVNLSQNGEIAKVFVPQKDITGRIMLGFTSVGATSQTVLLDRLDISAAEVGCDRVYISGYPYPEKILSGKHGFTSNFDTAEFSTFRWLVSSTADGVFVPIEGETTQTISVTSDMINSYIKFEVAPASLSGPVYGAAVSSAAVLICEKPAVGSGTPIEDEPPQPVDDDDKPTVVPSTSLVKKDGLLGVLNIYSESFKSSLGFVDIENHWAKADIDRMSAAGIVNGRGNMLFQPDEVITRAEFSAFLTRAFSLAPLYYSDTFDDVHSWDWYAGVVETVTKYDIARGVGGGRFLPLLPVTREQMTLMTMRALRLAGFDEQKDGNTAFADDADISAWAKAAVQGAVKTNIISGSPDGYFRPEQNATRAEAVAVIKRMITYVINS